MLLAIDIGNTNITIGLFDGNKLLETKRMPSDASLNYCQKLSQELNGFHITNCIIASVVDSLDTIIKNAVSSVYNIEPQILSTDMNMPVDFKCGIGADRIANVIAGINMYQLPLIIVDLGTANTFDIIDANKNFLGGLIAPGLGTQLKSLNMMTSKLPLLNIENSPSAIGNNTKDAILSGVIRGTACMISGMIEESEKELGQKATVIATGGLATVIEKYMTRQFDDINPNLTLLGIQEIYKLNQPVLH